MTSSANDVIRTSEASSALTRREWELRELVDEVQAQLAEHIERERVQELEIVSLRHELELRFAYEATLDERVLEQQGRLEWAHATINREAEIFAAVHDRLDGEIAAETQRTAEALQACAVVEWERGEIARERDDAARETEAARAELAAERARVSYRAVQRVTVQVKKHRLLAGVMRRFARVLTG